MSDPLIASVYCPPRSQSAWRIEDHFPGRECRLFSHARRALCEGLRAAGLGPGARVLLPGFICRELLSAFAQNEMTPLYYPVGPDLRPEEDPGSWPSADAVVAVDYFGFPQDLRPFESYAKRTGALLVEDNAHGLFSRDAAGALLGTRGDLGIISLRKTLPLPDGGLLLLTPGARPWEPAPIARFRRSLTGAQALRRAFRTAARLGGAPGAYLALDAFRRSRSALRFGAPPDGPEMERRYPGPDLPCAELRDGIRAGDPRLEAERRRALYLRVAEMLAPFAPPLFPLAEGVVPYGFPFRGGPQAEAAARALARDSLLSISWPLLPDAVRPVAPRHYRDVLVVPFLAL